MGVVTKIAWCHHTWNPWRGCWKISEGCANCYAERGSKRSPGVLGEWGKDAARVIAADAYWRLPYRWNAMAEQAGERRRVFCLSLGDVFEVRPDLDAPRARLFETIERTPHLDWLLLTKRPENWRRCWPLVPVPGHVRQNEGDGKVYRTFPNVWVGASIENRARMLERHPLLREIPARVHFYSAEPLLGDLGVLELEGIDWVIFGGESGPDDKARPCATWWLRNGVEQCQTMGVASFVKQLGSWVETTPVEIQSFDILPAGPLLTRGVLSDDSIRVHLKDPKGADPSEWPADLVVQEFPR